MKIVQILLSDRVGGAESLALELGHQFTCLGHECATVFLDDRDRSRSPARRWLHLRRALRQEEADIVLAHSAIPILYSAAAAPTRSPVIAVLHSAGDDYRHRKLRWAHRLFLSRLRWTVAVSDDQAHRYRNRFGSSVRNLVVIPNGVDLGVFQPSTGAFGDGPLRLLTATRLVPWKRLEIAIEAVRCLQAKGLAVKLSVLGDGDQAYAEHLRSLVAEPPREDVGIAFLGSRPDVAELMRQHDALVHCSAHEGFSVALVEAAASGLPLFLSDALGPVPEGALIVRYADGDPESLAATLERFVEGGTGPRALAREAARVIASNYSIEACASSYLELFAELATRERRTSAPGEPSGRDF